MAKPISNGVEFIYTLETDSNYVDYEIRTSTSTIYNGRAYPIPGTAYIYFNITNILEDYCNLNGIKDNINLFTESSGNYIDFKFEYFVFIKEELYLSYTQFNTDKAVSMYLDDNNSFDFIKGGSLQMKRNYEVTKDCWLIYNYFGNSNNVYYSEGLSGWDLNVINKGNPLFEPFYWFKKASTSQNEYVKFYSSELPRVNTNYHILPCSNATGCLYWVNRFGGFETLLVKGKNLYSTDNKSLNYRQSPSKVINGTLYKRTFNQSNTIIKKDITKRWVLNTSYLLDTDWNWIESLYTSPIVYFQEFTNNVVHSVVVTDTTFERQLFKENGRKIPNYEINIESSIINTRR